MVYTFDSYWFVRCTFISWNYYFLIKPSLLHDFDRFLAEACDGFFKFESKCLGVKCGRIRKQYRSENFYAVF